MITSAPHPALSADNQTAAACALTACLCCPGLQSPSVAAGFPTATIHSGKDQATRGSAIEGFKSGEKEVLVATDIAGRGIDVEGVEHVINYDMPKDIASYTHRIGRTGRAGRKGIATTFVTGEGVEGKGVLFDLRMMLASCKQAVPPELARHPAAQDAETRAKKMNSKDNTPHSLRE